MRTIDKSKKSNIKCEHCKYCQKGETIYSNSYCVNEESPKYEKGVVNYWNRCKKFEWAESEEV